MLTLDRQTQDYCCCFRERNLPNPTHLPTQQNAGRRECRAAEQYTYLAAINTKHKRPRHLLYYNLLTTTKKSALLSHRVLLRTASEQANGNQIATYSLVCSAPEKRANERATEPPPRVAPPRRRQTYLSRSLSPPVQQAHLLKLLFFLRFPFLPSRFVSFRSFVRSFLPWQCVDFRLCFLAHSRPLRTNSVDSHGLRASSPCFLSSPPIHLHETRNQHESFPSTPIASHHHPHKKLLPSARPPRPHRSNHLPVEGQVRRPRESRHNTAVVGFGRRRRRRRDDKEGAACRGLHRCCRRLCARGHPHLLLQRLLLLLLLLLLWHLRMTVRSWIAWPKI